ncbi:T6SS immunity protein Tdi1 domain-containing protein [Salana multivorans]
MESPYTFLTAYTPLAELDVWEGNLGVFTHVFGHSFLGHLFVWSPDHHYGIAYPYLGRYKDYGVYETPTAFQEEILEDPYVRRSIFQEDLLPKLRERLGPCESGEVYYPVPYEILGGSGAPETYDKGSLTVWASLVGQVHGLTARPTGDAGTASADETTTETDDAESTSVNTENGDA